MLAWIEITMQDEFLALKDIQISIMFIFLSRYAEAKCRNDDYSVHVYHVTVVFKML